MEPWLRWTYQHCPWRPSSSIFLCLSVSFVRLLQATTSNNLHHWINKSYRNSSSSIQGRSMLFKIHKIPVLVTVPQSNCVQKVPSYWIHHHGEPQYPPSPKKPLENPSTSISKNLATIEGISLEDCKISQFPNAACGFWGSKIQNGSAHL